MPIDPAIALGVRQPEPVNYLGQAAQVMALRAAQDEMQGNEGVRQAIQGGMDPTDPRMFQYGKRGADVVRAGGAAHKEKLEAGIKSMEFAARGYKEIYDNPTMDTVTSILGSYVQNGIMPAAAAQAALAKAAANPSPENIRQLAQAAMSHGIDLKDRLTTQLQDLGGTSRISQIDKLTGKVTTLDETRKTISPDAAAQVGATIRGQDLTDTRARYIHDNPHSTLQVVDGQVLGVQGVPGAMPRVTQMPPPGAQNALVGRPPATSVSNYLRPDSAPTESVSIPPPAMTPKAFDLSQPAPAAAPAAWKISAKPVWNAETKAWMTPPDAQNPEGTMIRPAEVTAPGKRNVGTMLDKLYGAYEGLQKAGGITDVTKPGRENIGPGLASTDIGQATGKMFGTPEQSFRNEINTTRPLLLAAIKDATGMSSKQMDSNTELQLYLSAATNPGLDIQTNIKALNTLSKMYGLGKDFQMPEGPAPRNAPSTAATAAPSVGTVSKGYRFKGGDPALPSSWEKQ